MSDLLFPAPSVPTIAVNGERAGFPVHRIFCVGRNYAAHAAEMGNVPDYEAPFYFTKSPSHTVQSGAVIPYPLGTTNYHHEMELAVLIGAPAFRVDETEAMQSVYGYCCALDMTRRDLQAMSKEKRRPWDTAKDFEDSAIFAPATKRDEFGPIGAQRIALSVNGEIKQDASLAELIHSVPAVISDLSKYYHLNAGDVILTGTPAGVGAVNAGDHLSGEIDGLDPITLRLGDPE